MSITTHKKLSITTYCNRLFAVVICPHTTSDFRFKQTTLKNHHMNTVIKGRVNLINQPYFDCLDLENLEIRVFSITVEGFNPVPIDTIDEFDSNGCFEKEIDTVHSHLIVQLIHTYGSESTVATSKAFCKADNINLTFEYNPILFGGTLYNRIQGAIDANIGSLTLMDLSPEQAQNLACLTCTSYSLIDRFINTEKAWDALYNLESEVGSEYSWEALSYLKARTEFIKPILFALISGNKFTSLEELLFISISKLQDLITSSCNNNEISSSVNEVNYINAIIELRNLLLLNNRADGHFNEAKLIHLADIDYEIKANFLDKAILIGSFIEEFNSASLDADESLNKVFQLFELSKITEYHIKYTSKIVTHESVLPYLYPLNYSSLISLGQEFYEDLITEPEDRPSYYESDTEYAYNVFSRICDKLPTKAVAVSILATNIEDAAEISDLLLEHPLFDIKKESAVMYFNTGESGSPEIENEALFEKIKALQRCLKLTGDVLDLKATSLLFEHELTSSFKITEMGEEAFVNLMSGVDDGEDGPSGGDGEPISMIDRQHAQLIYTNADATRSMLNANTITHFINKNGLTPEVFQNTGEPGTSVLDGPNITDIFGSFDSCACNECQSVYGAAAYLTDMLNWLKKDVAAYSPFTKALSCLEESVKTISAGFENDDPAKYDRRRDIRYIDLTCKNTNTLVPYIDLVNEILSVNLMKDTVGYTDSFLIDDMELLQSNKTSEEILIQPEHRFVPAETMLKTVYYPWNLPYEVPFDECISYAHSMGSPLHILIERLSSDSEKFDSDSWMQTYLNINPAEQAIIKNQNFTTGITLSITDFWKNHYHLTANPGSPVEIGFVLKATELELEELRQLLLTTYHINGSTKITINEPLQNQCIADEHTFSAFSEVNADRLLRFVRLMKKTGLSSKELDLAILNTINNSSISADFMKALASRIHFAKEHALNFIETEIWFRHKDNLYQDPFNYNANFAPNTHASDYYNNKFKSPLLPQAVRTFFNTSTVTFNNLTHEHKEYLCLVLNTNVEIINKVIDYLKFMTWVDGANHTLISKLYLVHAYVHLSQVFAIPATELINVLTILGDPLNTGISELDRVKEMWKFKFKYSNYLKLNATIDELDTISTGSFTNLAAEAEIFYNKINLVFEKAVEAHPEKEYDNTTELPSSPDDADFFKLAVANAIEHEFKFGLGNTVDFIDIFYNSWLLEFIKISATSRSFAWASASPLSIQDLYKYLKRIYAFKQLLNLDEKGITSAKEIYFSIGAASAIDTGLFFWLDKTDYASIDGTKLNNIIWLNQGILMADELKFTQSRDGADNGVFYYLNHYQVSSGTYVVPTTSTTLSNPIVIFYASIGDKSLWKEIPIEKFTNLFVKSITKSTATDLISLFNKMKEIKSVTLDNSLKIDEAWSWVWTDSTGNSSTAYNSSISADIRRSYESRHLTRQAWSNAIVPVQNMLRTNLRNALVAYHIGKKGFKSSNHLFNYYLIDTQMESCMKTSRILAAVSSVQLLIHRSLLGREPLVKFDNKNKKEWEWRKNFRVWQANRKVFLYPENWIDPSLRNNKTQLFKDFENAILQGEINDQYSEKAYANYLTELNNIARLDIRGFYEEKDPVTNKVICTHVFGRTWNPPYKYYYRTYAAGIWSGWEDMNIELDSEHIIPVIFNRKLYMFYTIFVEKSNRRYLDTTNTIHKYVFDNYVLDYLAVGHKSECKYYEIALGYTKLDFGKWTQKKILKDKLWAGPLVSESFELNENGLDQRVGYMTEQYNGSYFQFSANNNSIPLITHSIMEQNGFYFWPEINSLDDNLYINLRRAFATEDLNTKISNTHNLFAFEWRFRINVSDEMVNIVKPNNYQSTNSRSALHYIARPDETRAFGQQMKSRSNALKIKWAYNPWPNSGSAKILTASDFVLTYPAQYEHSYVEHPFFFADKKNSLFFPFLGDRKHKAVSNQHPFVYNMMAALNKDGVEGLLNPPTGNGLKRQQTKDKFINQYSPVSNYVPTVATVEPHHEYDFSLTGTYSIYNWEVFFHSLTLIIKQLREHNKFAEAIRWIHFIFNPADDEASPSHKKEYWQTKPFFKDVSDQSIQNIMRLLSLSNSSLTAAEVELKKEYNAQINVWRKNPFDPHVIGGMRPRAYMLWVVMEYVTTLTDWGDFLFRQDTMESIHEALNLYMMASEILGKRPQRVTKPVEPETLNFNDIQGKLNNFSNAMDILENSTTTIDLNPADFLPQGGTTYS